jgi:hypothetical protein
VIQKKLNCQILVREQFNAILKAKAKNLVAIQLTEGFGVPTLLTLVYMHPDDE